MISWWNLTLQFLCLFLCTLHLAEANCVESFDPRYWSQSQNITLDTLTERFPLNDADSFEDVLKCTLGSKILKKDTESYMGYLKEWFECLYEDEYEAENPTTFMKTSNCRESNDTLSFTDLVCLLIKASNMSDKIDVCSHGVVVELYSRFYKTPIATTLPTTTELTTTATSTTEEKSSKNSTPPVTTWSTSVADLQSPAEGVTLGHGQPESRVDVDRAVFSLLGLSLLMNVALAICVALLCCRIRSNQGASGNVENGVI